MGTLAQLLDRTATNFQLQVQTNPTDFQVSSPSPSSLNLSSSSSLDNADEEDVDDEMEIVYKRPTLLSHKNIRVQNNLGLNNRQNRIVTVSSSTRNNNVPTYPLSQFMTKTSRPNSMSVLSMVSPGARKSQDFRRKDEVQQQKARRISIPGSGLSFTATSLPQPRIVDADLIESDSNKRRKKPLPALSPINSRSYKSNPGRITKMEVPGPENPSLVIVNVTSLSQKPVQRPIRPSPSSGTDSPTSSVMIVKTDGSLRNDQQILVHGMLKPGKKNQNTIKRPLNAFMVWSQLQRRKIMDSDPTMHHSLISKQLGAGWKALTEEGRRPFYEEAKRLGELHNQIYPNYKYKPRRKDNPNRVTTESFVGTQGSMDQPISNHITVSFPDSLFGTKHIITDIRRGTGTDGCLDLSMKTLPKPVVVTQPSVSTSVSNSSSSKRLKSGLKKWSEVYADSDEDHDDDDRLFIDEDS